MLRYFYWLFLVFVLTGCGANIQNHIADVSVQTQKGSRNHYINQYAQPQKIHTNLPLDEDMRETDERIQILKKKISMMDGVEDAIVSLTNNNAVIGLTMNKEVNDRNIIELKNKVELKAKAIDKHLNLVSVTVAPELISRLSHHEESENGLPADVDRKIEKFIPIVGI